MVEEFAELLMQHVAAAFETIKNGMEYVAQSVEGGYATVTKRAVRLGAVPEVTTILTPAYLSHWSVGATVRNGTQLTGKVVVICPDHGVRNAFAHLVFSQNGGNNYQIRRSAVPNGLEVLSSTT